MSPAVLRGVSVMPSRQYNNDVIIYVVFNKREVVFYQSTKGRGRSPRPFVL